MYLPIQNWPIDSFITFHLKPLLAVEVNLVLNNELTIDTKLQLYWLRVTLIESFREADN